MSTRQFAGLKLPSDVPQHQDLATVWVEIFKKDPYASGDLIRGWMCLALWPSMCFQGLSMEDLSAGCKAMGRVGTLLEADSVCVNEALGFPEDLVETLFLGLHPNPGL